MSSKKTWFDRRSGENGRDRKNDYRSPFMRDECRVIHSFGFRRLQGKTQILGPDQGDFHRNRMTHSIEVASICRSIVLYLKRLCKEKKYEDYRYSAVEKLLEEDGSNYPNLMTAIGLLHDIGHPPFGHGGEVALNFKMHSFGGFEGNAQTLRLLTKSEDYTLEYGLDLTRLTLLGLVKYPASYKRLCNKFPSIPNRNRDIHIEDWRPPKCYYDEDQDIIDWLLDIFSTNDRKKFVKSKLHYDKNNKVVHSKTEHKSFECSIMDIADNIAYSVHDIEDAIHLGLINQKDLEQRKARLTIFDINYENWIDDLFNKNECKAKSVLGHMVHVLINHIEIVEDEDFENPRLKYKAVFEDKSGASKAVEVLNELIKDKVLNSQEIQTIVFGGMMTVMQLFDAIIANPENLLSNYFRGRYEKEKSLHGKYRCVCDYISGMTDEYARRMHERVYGDNPRSVFEKL